MAHPVAPQLHARPRSRTKPRQDARRPARPLRLAPTPDLQLPSLARWTALCATAEAVGMTAAAAAAKISQSVVGDAAATRDVVTVLAIVVAGGLVEGVALGVAQSRGLAGVLSARTRRAWVAVTVVVAGLGWAGASIPGALAGDSGSDDAGTPPWLLVIAGALALGAAMGALLGGAQGAVLRGQVAHPWRWVGACATAWPPTMAIIFVGASTPSATWAVAPVVLLGTVTGAVAGAALGLVSGWFLPALTGRPPHERMVVALLGSRAHRLLDRSLVVLRVTGTVTARVHSLPVSYAADADGLVVLPGHPETKRWWRNLRRPAGVRVLHRGTWCEGVGTVLLPTDAAYAVARATYLRRWPRIDVPEGQPLVRLVRV